MYTALRNALQIFSTSNNNKLKMIVVLSDGETDDTRYHSSVISTAKSKNVKIHTVGLGNSSSSYFTRYMKPLASETGGKFYLAANAGQLGEIYDEIGKYIDIETDSDNDGIPDYYEENLHMFNGMKVDKLYKNNPDSDGDGLLDGEEIELHYEYSADRKKVKVTGKFKSNPTNPDTDGDGKNDKDDPNPLEWDVCDRDLVMSSLLAYANGKEAADTKTYYGKEELEKLNTYDIPNTSVYELKDWNVVDYEGENGLHGFSATTLQNGRNIIIAFRGTQFSNINDLWADLSWMWYGNPQKKHAIKYAQRIANEYPNSKIYLTGHSLGGYLNIAAADCLVSDSVTKSLVERVVCFNGLGAQTWNDLLNLRDYVVTGNVINYVIKGDIVSRLGFLIGEAIEFDTISEIGGIFKEHRIANFLKHLHR